MRFAQGPQVLHVLPLVVAMMESTILGVLSVWSIRVLSWRFEEMHLMSPIQSVEDNHLQQRSRLH